MIKRIEKQSGSGVDLVVGDIRGHFSKLQAALDAVGFEPERGDRLFSVGDLVDRGPESADVLDWLDKPWFHAVQGNHEDMAIRWGQPGCRMDRELYTQNGGLWNIANTMPERVAFSDALGALPLAIEIETEHGLVGVIHAGCPLHSWDEFRAVTESNGILTPAGVKSLRQQCLWDRSRIERGDTQLVAGVRAVVVGHTPVSHAPRVLGNTIYIDSGAWAFEGTEFCLLDVATLLPAGELAGVMA